MWASWAALVASADLPTPGGPVTTTTGTGGEQWSPRSVEVAPRDEPFTAYLWSLDIDAAGLVAAG